MTLGELLTGLGYAVGALVFYWAARSRQIATQGIGWIAAWGLFAGVVGAKLTQGLAQGRLTLDPSVGGRSLLGGLICGWLAVELVKRRLGMRRCTGDLFALALPIGEAVGRIGCYFNGCCYGTESSVPWAVWQHGALRHPAQFYSAIVGLATFGLMLWARPRVPSEGCLFRLYLLVFGVTRFGLEFLRWRETVWFGLSPMQWFCIELVIFAAVSIAIRRRRMEVRLAT